MPHHDDATKEGVMLLNLKMAILQHGKGQTRMAVDLGLDPARLSRIVNELAVSRPDERKAIASYLGGCEDDLFDQTRQPEGDRHLTVVGDERPAGVDR
jgi:hypothetical protein